MGKKILVYKWGSLSEPSICHAFSKTGFQVVEFAEKMKNYHADAEFAQKLIARIHREKVQAVFSFDYFPLVAMVCDVNKIPYMAWIYDCPQYTLNSPTLALETNYIYCFDAIYSQRISGMGAKHCFHMPLSANGDLADIFQKKDAGAKYRCDISFVGSLYNDGKNRLRNAVLSDYTKGFVEGLVNAQLRIYGFNFIRTCLDGADGQCEIQQSPNKNGKENPRKGSGAASGVIEEVVEKCGLSLGEHYHWSPGELAADAIGMEVTAREREKVVSTITQKYPLDLYTGSVVSEKIDNKNIRQRGFADYFTEVPFIFRDSRINLNITSKTIESGIPQRVLDILSCGGFCITNYQPEIDEMFRDGEELVMYAGMEDMMEKAAYFLTHEDERRHIAEKGQKRVLEEFSPGEKLREMLFLAGL